MPEPNEALAAYLDDLATHLRDLGFAPMTWDGADAVWRKRGLSLAMFGMVDTFAIVRWVASAQLTPGEVQRFSASAFEFGLAHKNPFPRGFGGTAVVHALIATDGVPEATRAFVASGYCPKHWAAFEFPAVIALPARELVCYSATPLWGAAYYTRFRNQVKALFGSF